MLSLSRPLQLFIGFLISFISLNLAATSVEFLKLEDGQELHDLSFSLKEVIVSEELENCVGFTTVQNKSTPFYFENGGEPELSAFLHSLVPKDKDIQIGLQIHRFFLYDKGSWTRDDYLSLDLNLEVYAIKEEQRFRILRIGESISSSVDRETLHEQEFIRETFKSILRKVEEELSSSSNLENFPSEGIGTPLSYSFDNTLTMPPHDGVFWTYRDFCMGQLDSSEKATIKREKDENLVKLDWKNKKSLPWAYWISGHLYLNYHEEAIRLRLTPDGAFTQVTLSEGPSVSELLLAQFAFGIIGTVLVSTDVDHVRVDLKLDELTGSLLELKHGRQLALTKEVILYHSSYSKQETIAIAYQGKSIELPKNTRLKVLMKPHRSDNRMTFSDDTEMLEYEDARNGDRILLRASKSKVKTKKILPEMYNDIKKKSELVEF